MSGTNVVVDDQRGAVFITHANPEDNAFTTWLGAKLSALGYEVWADILAIRGGEDWQRKLEHALRHRARKVLLVGTSRGVQKQGVRNEIQIAHDVSRAISDHEFVIPLRLEPFEAPFLIAHAQYVDFQPGWTAGLNALLEALVSYGVPRRPLPADSLERADNHWIQIQEIYAKRLQNVPESLVSSWLRIEQMPAMIRLYEFRQADLHERASDKMRNAAWPLVEFGPGFLTFAPKKEVAAHFGVELPLRVVGTLGTRRFTDDGWRFRKIDREQARNYVADLFRQSFERFFHSKGLQPYHMANRREAWWGASNVIPASQVAFNWRNVVGRRQIRGRSEKRNVDWHFGVSVAARFAPDAHARLFSHLIFTDDGLKTIVGADRMHRLRRSFAKGWRNPRWRDMLLAFLFWLADGRSRLVLPTSAHDGFVLSLPPLIFTAPVSIPVSTESQESDDDDPAIEEEPRSEEELEDIAEETPQAESDR
jgi:hypothetical protein